MKTFQHLSLYLLAVALPAAGQPSVSQQHRKHVEAGLLPAVIVKGQAAPGRSLLKEMVRLHVPGVSVTVVHHGRVEWSKGYGVTEKNGSQVTPNTPFQAGSVSKAVSALCIMHLAQTGAISIDQDVNQVLKSWKLPSSSFIQTQPVTARELLSHTAGVNVHGFQGYRLGSRVPSLIEVLNGTPPANSEAVRVTEPVGEHYRYSGGGYTILQQMAIDVTGSSFPKLLESTVLRPIGMLHSTFEQPLSPTHLQPIAMPHDSSGNAVDGGPYVYPELAAAGLWSTSPDLAKYVLEIQRSLSGRANHVLSPEQTQKMLSPVKGDWSLGLEIGGAPANQYFYHDGSNQGYKATLVGYEHGGNGAVIMTNGDQGYELGLELVRSIAQEYHWPDFHPVQRTSVKLDRTLEDKAVGKYEIADLGSFEIRREHDVFIAEIHTGVADPLLASSDHSFFVISQDLVINFDPDSAFQTGSIIAGAIEAPFKRIPR